MRWVRMLLLLALIVAALDCKASAPKKKLIEMGWDEPDPAFMRAHIAQLEASPFDGCVYHLAYRGPDGKLLSFSPQGRPLNFAWDAWGARRFREDELASGLADLQATPFRRFRSTFLRINITPGDVDWFDDYGAILGNLELGASVARRGGSAGILLDTEPYEHQVFQYPAQRDTAKHSFPVYSEQARRRGMEVMRALERGYPGLTVFLTVSVTWPYLELRGNRTPIEQQRYGLLVPFVDGMVLAASDSARIVDGMEASYHVRDPAALDDYVAAESHGVLPWMSDSTRYRRVVSRSFGFWIDFDAPHRAWRTDDASQNYRPPEALRDVVRRALELSDEYVWVYGQKPRWWTAAGTTQDVPESYVKALRDARKGVAE